MKILILAHHAEGLYLPRRELMMRIKDDGHQLVVAVPQGNCFEQIAGIADKIVAAPIKRRGMNPITDFKLICFYYKLIKLIKPDCILTYAIKPNIYGGIVGRMCQIPYIMNITGLGTAFGRDNLLCKLVTFMYKMVAGHEYCVFFQNKANKQIMESKGVRFNNPVLIPGSGINLVLHKYEDYPADKNKIRFLFISRIMREKGIYELAEAVKIIRAEHPAVEFHVLGRCEAGYEEVMTKWQAEGVFVYHGHQMNVHDYLKKAHALIHPSYSEGMSNVCLEAAAVGRPILASNIPGCQEIFDDGISGVCFEPHDVDSIVKAVNIFLKMSYKQRQTMGYYARKKVECEFDRQLVIEAYMKQINCLGATKNGKC